MLPDFFNSDLNRLASLFQQRIQEGNAVSFRVDQSNSRLYVDEFTFSYSRPLELRSDTDLFRLWQDGERYGFHIGDIVSAEDGSCVAEGQYEVDRNENGELMIAEDDDHQCTCRNGWILVDCVHVLHAKGKVVGKLSILDYGPQEAVKPQESTKSV